MSKKTKERWPKVQLPSTQKRHDHRTRVRKNYSRENYYAGKKPE